MTLSYLYKPSNIQLDSSGSGVAEVGPDANQFWLPTSIHVGTKNPQFPTANCGLYVGAIGVLDYTTLIDYTFAGNNDTSSIIVGQIVENGQTISAQFLGGNPGDSAFMYVVGISSDVPPPQGILPGYAGARFSNLGVPQPYQYANRLIQKIDTGNLANNATFNILPGGQGRAYRLFDLYIESFSEPNDGTFQLFTLGTVIAISPKKIVGTPTNIYSSLRPVFHFSGAPLPVNQDLTIQNVCGVTNRFVGYIAYSY
jgi:hypothetical protein